VGKDRTYSTYEDYCLRRRRLAALHEYEYHVKNMGNSASMTACNSEADK